MLNLKCRVKDSNSVLRKRALLNEDGIYTYFYINTPINFLWNLTLFILVGETIIRLYNLNLLWNLENVGSMIFIDK